MVSFFMFVMDVSFWVGFDQELGGGEGGEWPTFYVRVIGSMSSLVLVEGHCDLLIVKERILIAL